MSKNKFKQLYKENNASFITINFVLKTNVKA